MDLSIAIVSWNTRDLLDGCLRSVYDTTREIEFEVIVVDNASADGSPEMVGEKYARAMLIANPDNVGFAAGNNQAYRASAGRHFLLLNPDTTCREGVITGLVRFLDEHPAAGAVGPLVTNDDGTLQYSWAAFPTLWSEMAGRLDRRIGRSGVLPLTADETRMQGPFKADWIGGCCLMIRREAAEQIGPMDESLFMYSEETDWCMRLRKARWEVWVDPSCEIAHLGGKSSDLAKAQSARHLRMSKRQYFRKHHGVWPAAAVGTVLAVKAGLRQFLRAGAGR
jgi:hypothetical protein